MLTDFNKARQAQVVSLIRVQFLKRFESSAKAFEMSCYRLLKKLLAWVTANIAPDEDHFAGRLQRWKIRHDKLINYVASHQLELWEDPKNNEPTEDFLTDEELQAAEILDPTLYDIPKILDHTFEDLDQLASFLDLVAQVEPDKDDKLTALKKLLIEYQHLVRDHRRSPPHSTIYRSRPFPAAPIPSPPAPAPSSSASASPGQTNLSSTRPTAALAGRKPQATPSGSSSPPTASLPPPRPTPSPMPFVRCPIHPTPAAGNKTTSQNSVKSPKNSSTRPTSKPSKHPSA